MGKPKNLHSYLQPVRESFSAFADPVKAAGAKAYMRNQFEFFGMQTPVRRMISREIFLAGLPTMKDMPKIIRDAWSQPEREFQYFAIELLAKLKKEWTADMITLVEKMIQEKSWWDSVDHINGLIAGPYFQQYPDLLKPVTKKWNQSENIWLQRSSIIFQKAYRQKTDTVILSAYIKHCSGSREFFIQKGIGWALREYAKTDPTWVQHFVATNDLPALSKREALKHFR